MRTRIPLFIACLGLLIAAPVLGGFHPDTGAETPVSDDSALFPDESQLEKRILPWSYFKAMADQDGVMVIDVREDFLGDPVPPGLETARPIPMEIFLVNFVERGANQGKTLLIFDHEGKSIRRLFRSLMDHGYEDFFFLSGGAVQTRGLVNRGS